MRSTPDSLPARAVATLEAVNGAVRWLVALAVAWALGFAGLVAALLGGAALTGCFLECTAPNPLVGVPATALAGVPVVGAIQVLAWGIDPATARRVGRRDVVVAGLLLGAGLATLLAVERTAPVAVAAAVAWFAAALRWWRRPVHLVRTWDATFDALPPWLRRGLGGLLVATNAVVLVVLATVGRCDFAGGRCPPEPRTLLSDEAFAFAAGCSTAIAMAWLVVTRRSRTWWWWPTAVAWGAVAGLFAFAATA